MDAKFVLEKIGIKPGWQVADFGCGNLGYFTFPAARIVGKSGIVYAVDILESVLSAIRSRQKMEMVDNVKPVWSDLEVPGATKIPEQSLDCALLINILFQARKHQEIFKEALRLLKTGGRIAVIDWEERDTPLGPTAAERVNKNAVRDLAKQFGLQEIEEFTAGPYHYGLIFQR